MGGVSLLPCVLLLLEGTLVLSGTEAQRVRAGHQNLKVRIRATGDTIVLQFVRSSPEVQLQGFVLGHGSGLFPPQMIRLPQDGRVFEAEMDAEPRYLVAVQPLAVDHRKRHCTGKVNLEQPLPLVVVPVSPSAVLLSWGNELKTPYEGDVMDQCLEDGFYTVRYRERSRKWNYQTCPTSDTVVDHLKPNTPYEFGVRSHKDERSSSWSKPLVHRTTTGNHKVQKTFTLRNPLVQPPKPVRPLGPIRPRPLFPPRPALHNRTTPRLSPPLKHPGVIGATRTSGSAARLATPINKRPNLVGKPGATDKLINFKQTDSLMMILKPRVPAARATPTRPATPTTPATRQETWEDSDLFRSQPASDLDALGRKRYVAPHVVYQTGKKPDEPCSITSSLNFFPGARPGDTNVTAPPRNPPSNVTVVTVEGCPSFIILDWDRTDNDTTEYEVISTAKGPDGEQVSVLTTNQTHTAVENLRPESSYEFKVTPKNELGVGPPSGTVSFSTESADPRVSENISGKDAIWTRFPFRTDSSSDCRGTQYVKRTWYRKFVGVQLCNSLRYKIYLSDSLTGRFYDVGDQTGFGEDHCQFVDSFLDGRTGRQLSANQLPSRPGFYRAVRQEPVHFGPIGADSHVSYVSWYECGTPIPGKW